MRCILASIICSAFPLALHAQSGLVLRLEVFPSDRILHGPHNIQQLAVIAHFADGDQRDVTQLTQFTSSDDEIATVDRKARVTFAKTGEVAIYCRYQKVAAVRLAFADPKPGFLWPNPPENNLIDHLVFAKLKQLSIMPSDLCSDLVFLRRAYLDVCGLLPTARETKRFMDDARADKRTRLIDELLDRPEYAERWAHLWAELLDLPLRQAEPKLGAAYVHWLRGHVRGNTPMDRVVREILVGTEVVTDRGPASYYSRSYDSNEAAERTAAVFLGIRLQCAQCHPLFNTRWTQPDWPHFAAFFSQVKAKTTSQGKIRLETVEMDLKREWLQPLTREAVAPRFPDGTVPELKPLQDRREVLAAWLTSPKNPYFARVMVNYIWRGLIGKGFVESPEMLHEMPFTANDALLDVLAKELVTSRFDGKQMIRVIMNSRTYQLAAATKLKETDDRFLSHGYARRTEGAVFSDILSQFLEDPEEFDKMPPGTRAVHVLHSGLFWGGVSGPARRSVCDGQPKLENLASTLHLLNSDAVQVRLKKPTNRVGRLLAEKRSDREMLDDLFMAAFSRLPDEATRKQVDDLAAKSKDRREAWETVLWALMNTREFIMRP